MKAQGMPINVIIIAILALLVMIVVIAIFLGKTVSWGKNTGTCEGIGGIVVKKSDCLIGKGELPLGRNYKDVSNPEIEELEKQISEAEKNTDNAEKEKLAGLRAKLSETLKTDINTCCKKNK